MENAESLGKYWKLNYSKINIYPTYMEIIND